MSSGKLARHVFRSLVPGHAGRDLSAYEMPEELQTQVCRVLPQEYYVAISAADGKKLTG
jgi:hypothetical protein